MKTITTIIIILMSSQAYAGRNTIEDWLEGVTGVFTAYAVHEVGHAFAMYATNTDSEWHTGEYNQPIAFTEHSSSNQDGLIVNGSGLMAQLALSELILQSDIDKNEPFVRGMMFWNIVNPIVYALDYWIIRRTNKESDGHYHGDLEGIEHYSSERNANMFAVGMIEITLNQGYRYMQTQDWCPELMRRDDMRLGLLPVGGDGVGLMIEIDF